MPMDRYACALNQEELRTLGAWRHKRTGRYHPPSRATLHPDRNRPGGPAGGPEPLGATLGEARPGRRQSRLHRKGRRDPPRPAGDVRGSVIMRFGASVLVATEIQRRPSTGTVFPLLRRREGSWPHRRSAGFRSCRGLINYPEVRQVFRVTRKRDQVKTGEKSIDLWHDLVPRNRLTSSCWRSTAAIRREPEPPPPGHDLRRMSRLQESKAASQAIRPSLGRLLSQLTHRLGSSGWVPAVAAPSGSLPSGRTGLDVDGHQHLITRLPRPGEPISRPLTSWRRLHESQA